MISLQSRIFNFILKLINKKHFLRRLFKYNKLDLFSSPQPTRKLLSTCDVNRSKVLGRNVFTIRAKGVKGDSGKQILYLHGGAYVQNFMWPHWNFLSFLARNTNCTITAPDYPLAPKHTYEEAFAMVSEVYQEVVKTVAPSDFILMGDSAGGGMALALAQLMRNENKAQPDQIILLSPWLDLSLSNPEIKDIDPSDFFLDVEGLKMAGKGYAGDTDPDHYLLSPINGSLEGLSRISIFIGSREILAADARKLKAKAEAKGIAINYHEYPGMFHAWMLLNLPESKKAKRDILELLK